MTRIADPPPDRLLAQLVEDTRDGAIPDALAELFREIAPAPRRGWLARRLWGPPRERDYRGCRIARIEPFADHGLFTRSRVFTLVVQSPLDDHLALEGFVLPSGGSFGLFSIAADGVRYLQRRPDQLTALLASELRPLDAIHATTLALLLVEALGRRVNESSTVLRSVGELDAAEPWNANGYRVDPRELDRVRGELIAPTLRHDGAGWVLSCCAVHGWMHDLRTLLRYDHRVASDYRITEQQRTLSHKIFRSVPGVIY